MSRHTVIDPELRAVCLTGCSPIKSTWLGGAYLATDRTALKEVQVTRQEYLEHGSTWLGKVFAGSAQR